MCDTVHKIVTCISFASAVATSDRKKRKDVMHNIYVKKHVFIVN